MEKPEIITRYISDLERALRDADPAVIHEAILDANAHFDEAMRNGIDASQAIADYGRPDKVAQSYLGEKESDPTSPKIRGGSGYFNPAAIWLDREAWGAYLLLIFGGLIAALWGLATQLLLLLGLATLPLLIGFPICALLIGSARRTAPVIAVVFERMTGILMPRAAAASDTVDGAGPVSRLLRRLKDRTGLTHLLFIICNFWILLPVATVFLGITFAGWICIKVGMRHMIDVFAGDSNARELVSHAFASLIMMLAGGMLLTGALLLSKSAARLYARVMSAFRVLRPATK